MRTLNEYLKSSAQLDATGDWRWETTPSVDLLGANDFDGWLAEQPAAACPMLVPVSGWYTHDATTQTTKQILHFGPTPAEYVAEKSAEHGLAVNHHIKKLIYTDATGVNPGAGELAQPSWFVSPKNGEDAIKPGQEYVLVDDTKVTGGTLRDLVKHISLRGGIVRAVVVTENESFRHVLNDEDNRKQECEKLCALTYAVEHGMVDRIPAMLKAKDAFDCLGFDEQQKATVMLEATEVANQQLKRRGLALDQLTNSELETCTRILNEYSKQGRFTAENFWRYQLMRIPSFLPARVDEVERKSELAPQLGLSEQKQWAQTDHKSRRDKGDSWQIGG